MDFKKYFDNVGFFMVSAEKWIKGYFNSVGYKVEYTFVTDFAMCDWLQGIDGIEKTYELVKKDWLDDYKAFTEVVMSINLMSWLYNQLIRQGVTREDVSCEELVEKYSELYYKAREDFYAKYEDDDEACHYFFETTD